MKTAYRTSTVAGTICINGQKSRGLPPPPPPTLPPERSELPLGAASLRLLLPVMATGLVLLLAELLALLLL